MVVERGEKKVGPRSQRGAKLRALAVVAPQVGAVLLAPVLCLGKLTVDISHR